MKKCNEILERILQLTESMVELADLGDGAREDVGCGVVHGLLRDSAFKIRKVAEQEKEDHIKRGWWPEEKKSVKGKAALRKSDGGCRKSDETADRRGLEKSTPSDF